MITVNKKIITWYKDLTIYKFLKQIQFGENFAVVRINKKLVSKPNFHLTAIKNNSDIEILPMIAGG